MTLQLNHARGNTLTEYAIIIGLVAVLAIGGLTAFRGSLSGLFASTSGELTRRSDAFSSLDFNGSAANGGNTGNQNLTGTAGTGGLPLSDGATSATNTTSAEGQQIAVAKQVIDSAKQMQALASTITDPATQKWAADIAKYAYYLGGAQGDLAGVPALTINDTDTKGVQVASVGIPLLSEEGETYTTGNAMVDVYTYQQEIQKLLQNPPKNISAQDLQQVTTLANSVLNGAQGYVAELAPYTNSKGQLDTKSIARTYDGTKNGKLTDKSYDDLVKLSVLQATSDTVLSTGAASNTTAEGTLQAATALDNTATSSQGKSGATPGAASSKH